MIWPECEIIGPGHSIHYETSFTRNENRYLCLRSEKLIHRNLLKHFVVYIYHLRPFFFYEAQHKSNQRWNSDRERRTQNCRLAVCRIMIGMSGSKQRLGGFRCSGSTLRFRLTHDRFLVFILCVSVIRL